VAILLPGVRPRRARVIMAVALAASAIGTACKPSREREPTSDSERLVRGRELVEKMSARLAAAPAFSVHTTGFRDLGPRRGKGAVGDTGRVTLSRDIVVRRPNELYFRTTGGPNMEGWYNGNRLILAGRRDKVFAAAPMPSTLDSTLDEVTDRYGVFVPGVDLLYTSPAEAMLSPSTLGGWVGRENIDGTRADHLAFQEDSVAWELWLPTQGEPLPLRLRVVRKGNGRPLVSDVRFTKWNLSPTVPDSLFIAKVPDDYEGVPLLQRESAVGSDVGPVEERTSAGEVEKAAPESGNAKKSKAKSRRHY